MEKIAVIDCQTTGISGDMLLSALVDLCNNKSKIIDSIFKCQEYIDGSSIKNIDFIKTNDHGISATKLILDSNDKYKKRKGIDLLRAITEYCDSLDLSYKAKVFSLETFKSILNAESKIHGENILDVHLHESSSIDTLVDIIGCALALDQLKFFDASIYSSPVAVGGGYLTFSHGTISNPSTALLEILKEKPFSIVGGRVLDELTTPTGAALLINLATNGLDVFPMMRVEEIGYGAGNKKFENIPNILRIVRGAHNNNKQNLERICLLETNLDDVSGEIIGALVQDLSEQKHVKDVSVYTGITKKNRPSYLVRILSDIEQKEELANFMLQKYNTFGIRIQEIQRYTIPRTTITIQQNFNGVYYSCRIKIARNPDGKIISIKPEFEDILKISKENDIPIKNVSDLIISKVIEKL